MGPVNRHETTPFRLQLFYRTGAFHRPDEFAADPLPPHITIHTWSDCTLKELSYHLVSASHGSFLDSSETQNSPSTSLLPQPAIGTRLAFRLIFADTRHPEGPARFVTKELGSIVIGDEEEEDSDGEYQEEGTNEPNDRDTMAQGTQGDVIMNERIVDNDSDANCTLASARFVVGDYISCAILPPRPSDGAVAEPDSARTGRGQGIGEATSAVGRSFPPALPPNSTSNYPGEGGSGRGSQMKSTSFATTNMPSGFRGRGARGLHVWSNDQKGGGGMPLGEWKRGEELPNLRGKQRSEEDGGSNGDNNRSGSSDVRRYADRRRDPRPPSGPYSRRRGRW